MSNFSELEQIATAVLEILKTVPELANTKVAIIGGLALWKYLRRYRATQDVDLLITAAGAPKSVRGKLLALPNTPFRQIADEFVYEANGNMVQIDLVPDFQIPYLPPGAVVLSSVQANALPYISNIDLIVFKIFSCGLRSTAAKKVQDAGDARALLENVAGNGSTQLSKTQKDLLTKEVLEDVIRNSGEDEAWWKRRLGL